MTEKRSSNKEAVYMTQSKSAWIWERANRAIDDKWISNAQIQIT
jgi:hypothetical protein